MIPRLEVIADYPGSVFKVGSIVDLSKDTYVTGWETYPHLFRKLEWWEYRKPDEMPEYISFNYNIFGKSNLGIVFEKVFKWEVGKHTRAFIDEQLTQVYSVMEGVLPATEQEYTNFITLEYKKQNEKFND